MIGEVIEADGVDSVALNADERVVVLPPGHPLCQRDFVSAADLGGLDLLHYFGLEQSYLYRRYLSSQSDQVSQSDLAGRVAPYPEYRRDHRAGGGR